MKRIFSVLIIVSVFASLAGCGQDQYSIEREYWFSKKKAEKIFKNPHASPPKQLEKAVEALNNFIQKNPENALISSAEFNIARLYIVKGRYDDAREVLKNILEKNKESILVSAEARFLMGNSYQIEANWNMALKQYKRIVRDYPATQLGMEMPIYIAQYYKVKSLPDKMIAAYREAAAHYMNLAREYPDSVLSLTSERLASQCYITLREWTSAISVLNGMIEKYGGKVSLDEALMLMALIYDRELQDKVKTKEVLEKLVNDYPDSKLVAGANKMLEELNKDE